MQRNRLPESGPSMSGKARPKSFLEQHALAALVYDQTWTLSMYAALNDLSDETTAELRAFLSAHLPEDRLR